MLQASIPFTKMSGVGNDFIIVDNRTGILAGRPLDELALRVCRRRVSLGGDELMIIEPPTAGGDFSMRTINPDGGEVKMCGNAARCVARYAFLHGIAGLQMTIDTLGGPVPARVSADGSAAQVRLQVTSQPALDCALSAAGRVVYLNTIEISGAPHAVIFCRDVATAPDDWIAGLGAAIRHDPQFPHGVNVNFVDTLDPHTLWQRTFERGVEGETLACGTGAAASVVISALYGLAESPVTLRVRGGELDISFEREDKHFNELWLGGAARFIAEGLLHPEAWLT